jgi:hypothetical protein
MNRRKRLFNAKLKSSQGPVRWIQPLKIGESGDFEHDPAILSPKDRRAIRDSTPRFSEAKRCWVGVWNCLVIYCG